MVEHNPAQPGENEALPPLGPGFVRMPEDPRLQATPGVHAALDAWPEAERKRFVDAMSAGLPASMPPQQPKGMHAGEVKGTGGDDQAARPEPDPRALREALDRTVALRDRAIGAPPIQPSRGKLRARTMVLALLTGGGIATCVALAGTPRTDELRDTVLVATAFVSALFGVSFLATALADLFYRTRCDRPDRALLSYIRAIAQGRHGAAQSLVAPAHTDPVPLPVFKRLGGRPDAKPELLDVASADGFRRYCGAFASANRSRMRAIYKPKVRGVALAGDLAVVRVTLVVTQVGVAELVFGFGAAVFLLLRISPLLAIGVAVGAITLSRKHAPVATDKVLVQTPRGQWMILAAPLKNHEADRIVASGVYQGALADGAIRPGAVGASAALIQRSPPLVPGDEVRT